MFISELSIKNFGSFESAEFSFAPTGISAICGANGTGKSQIVGATLAAIIGRRAIKIDQAGRSRKGMQPKRFHSLYRRTRKASRS